MRVAFEYDDGLAAAAFELCKDLTRLDELSQKDPVLEKVGEALRFEAAALGVPIEEVLKVPALKIDSEDTNNSETIREAFKTSRLNPGAINLSLTVRLCDGLGYPLSTSSIDKILVLQPDTVMRSSVDK